MNRVPWKSIEEWLEVKEKLSSPNPRDWERAFEVLLMWKARCPNLPASVECTLSVLQVLVLQVSEQNESKESVNNVSLTFSSEANLQLLFSTAVIRFVNHLFASTSHEGSTLYVAARKQNIPDWVINLRHDCSHSASLPPLPLLEAAVDLAKKWLLQNYWSPQEEDMSGVAGSAMKAGRHEAPANVIRTLLRAGVAAWWGCRSALARNRTRVNDLAVSEWDLVVTFYKSLKNTKLGHRQDLLSRIHGLVKIGTEQRSHPSGNVLLNRQIGGEIARVIALLSQEGQKVSQCLLEVVVETGFLKSGGKNWSDWSHLVVELRTYDFLKNLLEYLLLKLATGTSDEKVCAEGWLLTLAPTMESLHRRWKSYLLVQSKGAETPSISKVHEDVIELPLRQPPVVRLDALRPHLMEPTAPTTAVVVRYLRLLSPELPCQTRTMVEDLVELYTENPDVDEAAVEKLVLETDAVSDGSTLESLSRTVSAHDESPWRKISIDVSIWRRSPFGVLPNQFEPDLELPELKWRVLTPCRKRKATE